MLRQRVSTDAMMAHLRSLQQIADANDGNRATGTPGYQASVDYIADALRSHGFDVHTPEFDLRLPFADPPAVTIGGVNFAAKPLEYTIGTPPDGVTGPLVAARVEDTPGCTAGDYDGLPVTGAVVLVDRGQCPFASKQAVAAQRGAVALIVANNVDGELPGATLGENTDGEDPGDQRQQGRRGPDARAPRPSHDQAQCWCAHPEHAQRHRPNQDRVHRRRGHGRRSPG